MQAVAAELSGYAGNPLLLLRKEFKQFVWISVFRKQLLN
jgi:hypothetical protein